MFTRLDYSSALEYSIIRRYTNIVYYYYYIADMPRPTEQVKRVFYADDLTVWATGVQIPDLEDSINSYLEEITAYLKDNSLLISAPKSTVTLFSPDPHQAKTHPRILIEDSHLKRVQCPKILGVYLDTSLSFNKHSGYVAERVSSINNILKALAGTSWGQQKETLLMTYKAVRRSIINYAAPVWSTNLRDTNYRNIQYTQNEALRMSSVNHIHVEAKMLKVRDSDVRRLPSGEAGVEFGPVGFVAAMWSRVRSVQPLRTDPRQKTR